MLKKPKGILSYWNLKEYHNDTKPLSIAEYDLYSDSHIIGEVNNNKAPYSFINKLAGNINQGKIKDAITLRIYWFTYGDVTLPKQTDDSQYHGGWVSDEIAALASLRLGIKLQSGGMTRSYNLLNSDPLGTPMATDVAIPHLIKKNMSSILPCTVKSVDISKLEDIFYLKTLSEDQYIALIRAARMYQDAIWIAESQPELAWLMLISSIETAANKWSSIEDTPTEKIKASKPELAKLLMENGGEQLLQQASEIISNSLGATSKFIKFCIEHMPEPPEKRPRSSAQIKWTKSNFRKILNKLYGYRSIALHGGTPFPAPLCSPPEYYSPDEGVTEKGSLSLATHTLGATWNAEDLPISMNAFSYFVNGVLNNWWDSMVTQYKE